MICLTGDIHHSSLKINEHRYIKGPEDSEVRIAVRYLKLIEKYNLKVTFYTTGKTLKEEWEDFKTITHSPLVEVGGHTYNGLPRGGFSKFWLKISGKPTISHSSSYGSLLKQKRDVQRMIDIVKKSTGVQIVSWRSHGLVTDKNTYPVLKDMGIRYISNDLNWKKIHPEKTKEGLISHPINVIMDHDHIFHAHRSEEYVEKQKKKWPFLNDPVKESYSIEEWGEIVEKQVLDIERRGGLATILMHPLCMFISDGFKTAERLLKVFSRFVTIWAKETDKYLKEE